MKLLEVHFDGLSRRLEQRGAFVLACIPAWMEGALDQRECNKASIPEIPKFPYSKGNDLTRAGPAVGV